LPKLAWDEITPVPENLQPAFRRWLQENGVTPEDAARSAYDYQGAFLAGVTRDVGGHFPDRFKQHGHESFSQESQYSRGVGDGISWDGEVAVPEHIDPAHLGLQAIGQRLKKKLPK
jgi:hypothetical protein